LRQAHIDNFEKANKKTHIALDEVTIVIVIIIIFLTFTPLTTSTTCIMGFHPHLGCWSFMLLVFSGFAPPCKFSHHFISMVYEAAVRGRELSSPSKQCYIVVS